MFKRVLILALATVALSACSLKIGSDTSSDGGGGSVDSPKPPPDLTAKLQKDDITSRTYVLKRDLNFQNADANPYTFLEGTPEATKMVTYSYAYAYGRRLSATEQNTLKSYCGFSVDVNESTKPADIDFPAGRRLVKGQIGTSSDGQDLTFSLQLQSHVFQSFFLSCKNVYSVDEIKKHVGDWIDIQ